MERSGSRPSGVVGWRRGWFPVYPGRVDTAPRNDLVLIGPPRLDGGGRASASWRRASAHRALRSASAVALFGPLTAHGRTVEATGLRDAKSGVGSRMLVLPGGDDLPQNGSPAGWLTALTADTTPTRSIGLGDGRTHVVPLDTLRMSGGRDAIGAGQLADLERVLAARPAGARTVLVMAHDPHGKPSEGKPLADRSALARLLERHPVALIAHGQRSGFNRGRFAGVPTVSPPPLAGCAVTGWRVIVRVHWTERDGPPHIEPLHFARPDDRPALAEAFAAADAAGAWTALAEKIVAADDTFEALAAEMRARSGRMDAIAEHGQRLDGALADLIRRAGGEP